jgi:hypothetical protein
MPDVREVYEMITKQKTSEPGALERQQKRQVRAARNKRIGAFTVAAAIAVAAVVLVLVTRPGEDATTPADGSPTAVPTVTRLPLYDPSVASAPWVTPTAMSDVDYLIDTNTGEMTPLPRAILSSLGPLVRDEGRYAASPDGSTLAYAGQGAEGSSQIFVARLDGSGVRQVTHDPVGAFSPAWSPDGSTIAYEGHGRGGVTLFVLEVATGEARQVIELPNAGASPTFTPDGTSLLFVGGSNQVPVLRTVPVAGGKSRLLIGAGEGITDAGNGSISPDGSLVTFLGSGYPASGEVQHCGPCRLIANADGTGRRVVPGWMAIPAGMWSPDSSRIVVMDGGDGFRSVITVVDVATEEATVVANGEWAIWVDDHTLLVQV